MLPPELSQYTGYLVRRAQQVHAALWVREGGSDVTSVQFGVLTLLASNPGIDQRALGELLQLDRSTIADLVSRMERRGYLERLRDERDRRRNILNLTDLGRVELAELHAHADNVNDALVEGLDDADRAELHRLLGIVIASRAAAEVESLDVQGA